MRSNPQEGFSPSEEEMWFEIWRSATKVRPDGKVVVREVRVWPPKKVAKKRATRKRPTKQMVADLTAWYSTHEEWDSPFAITDGEIADRLAYAATHARSRSIDVSCYRRQLAAENED